MRINHVVLLAIAVLALSGCVTSFSKGADRRTEGSYIEDGTIEGEATKRIKTKYADKVHININSYNRKVLITGEVADEAVKVDIGRIVGGVQNVSGINNELLIGPLAEFSAISSDVLATSNIKFRMQNQGTKEFRADRIKVVTEAGTAFLLGLVSHAEAKIATDIASTSSGVKRVVPLFEFID